MRQFKSYYVVWKHQEFELNTSAPQEFKSYYVVWKLFGCFDMISGIPV